MRILCINSNAMYQRGDGIYIYKATGNFLSKLSQLGYKINFFHFRKEDQGDDCLANFNLKTLAITVTGVCRRRSKVLSYLIAYPLLIRNLLKTDFLYFFYPNSFYHLLLIAIFLRKPFGLYIRGEKTINSRLSRFIFKRAVFITTISPCFTEKIRRVGGNAYTIKPMMDYSLDDIDFHRTFNKKTEYRILFLGRVEIDKGIFVFLAALRNLINEGRLNFTVDIVGDGPDLEKAKAIVSEKSMTTFIKFYGAIYDTQILKQFYKEADIFVLPTFHEGFPRVLYEAMIFGTPIITTFVGTISHIMEDGFNCHKIEARDEEALAQKIALFLDKYEEMSNVARGGTDTVKKYLLENNTSHESLVDLHITSYYEKS